EHDLNSERSEVNYSQAAARLAEASAQLRTIEELRKRARSLG
ncbi:MAG TPA: F0F1 ATP synthase subunit epsilon, partial [Porticoccaceae bacterium]|nr:F0F1 ATP synthase subunit epsilon [Porticoccaceae bacterium]